MCVYVCVRVHVTSSAGMNLVTTVCTGFCATCLGGCVRAGVTHAGDQVIGVHVHARPQCVCIEVLHVSCHVAIVSACWRLVAHCACRISSHGNAQSCDHPSTRVYDLLHTFMTVTHVYGRLLASMAVYMRL
jgi:hypothetical protein